MFIKNCNTFAFAMITPLVEIKNLSFAYGGNKILRDITVSIPANSLTAIMGQSGCGKTTLIRLIAGLETPHGGEIIINGKTVSAPQKITPPSQRGIGYIFQNLALWPHLTVKQHIAYVLSSEKTENTEKKIKETANFFKLDAHLNKYPHQLSGGQKQLLALARSMAPNPSLVLMDEPLTGMDPVLKEYVLDFILKIKSSLQTTIIYVTHDSREIEKTADKIVMMKDGKIITSGTPAELKNSDDEYVRSFFR